MHRLGVKEPPDSASQTIAFVAGKIKQAELLAIAAQKAEIERLEVERKEGLIAARKYILLSPSLMLLLLLSLIKEIIIDQRNSRPQHMIL